MRSTIGTLFALAFLVSGCDMRPGDETDSENDEIENGDDNPVDDSTDEPDDNNGGSDTEDDGPGDVPDPYKGGDYMELCVELDGSVNGLVILSFANWTSWDDSQWFNDDALAIDDVEDGGWICGWSNSPIWENDYLEFNGEYYPDDSSDVEYLVTGSSSLIDRHSLFVGEWWQSGAYYSDNGEGGRDLSVTVEFEEY